MRSLTFALLLCLLGVVSALSTTGNRLLAVLDDVADKDKYSQLWSDLRDRGYQIDYKQPKENPHLFQHGERAYDHVIIFPSKLKALGPALTPQNLLNFVKADGNILLTLSSEIPTPSTIVSTLLELDINLPAERTSITIDHFNYDTVSAPEKHDVMLLSVPTPENPKKIRADLNDYFAWDAYLAWPKTVGQVLGDGALLTPLVYAPKTAYTYDKDQEGAYADDVFATGEQMALASAMQARNSARFTVLGSAEMLEDKWFTAKALHNQAKYGQSKETTGNRAFAKKITSWTFQESGVIKVGRVKHFLNEPINKKEFPLNLTSVDASAINPKMYRIKNDVTYTVEISEYVNDQWVPFIPPSTDQVQLEFSMLSPFYRIPLLPPHATPNSTIWSANLKLPDQHGIFNFMVNYKRPFSTYIEEKETVTVRHFAHDEWPRSWVIPGAWVYMAGIWATTTGFILFVGVWLWSAPPKGEKKTN